MRSTRDLLRPRTYRMRQRAERLTHKLARAVSFILSREKALDLTQFLTAGRREAGAPNALLDIPAFSLLACAVSPSLVASTRLLVLLGSSP
jgi:hypothetical protein